MKRPFEISTTAVLLVMAALASIVLTLLNIGGVNSAELPAAAGQMPEGAPDLAQILSVVRGVMIGMLALGLVASLLAAFGLWRLSKWGYWLAMILGVLKVLSGVPMFLNRSVPISPVTFGQLAVGVLVLIFLFLRDSREAFFPERR